MWRPELVISFVIPGHRIIKLIDTADCGLSILSAPGRGAKALAASSLGRGATMAALKAAQSEELEALRARVKALEERCAEYESNEIVEPYIEANKKLEQQVAQFREKCQQVERENATLSLSLAYFHTQMNDEVETIASEPTPQKNEPAKVIHWGDEQFSDAAKKRLDERLRAESDTVRYSDDALSQEEKSR